MSDMTFEEWIETTSLPSMAKEKLPRFLSNQTQTKLLKYANPEEINGGSIESIEVLINKRLGL